MSISSFIKSNLVIALTQQKAFLKCYDNLIYEYSPMSVSGFIQSNIVTDFITSEVLTYVITDKNMDF